jgi:ring-1,2-phenylacetyl-CoA epoxidase subunit PaaD
MVAAERARSRQEQEVWEVLESVPDPEIPILNVVELGIIRFVRWQRGTLHVGITPTYSGCPATDVIRRSVRSALEGAGYADAVLEERLTPPWSSDWLTSEAHRKLREFGIAPPERSVMSPRRLLAATLTCPRCGSTSTSQVSEFGSTPCKAHHRCNACLEPFDSFKCI